MKSLPILEAAHGLVSESSEGNCCATAVLEPVFLNASHGLSAITPTEKKTLKVGLIAYNWEVDTSLALWNLELYAKRHPLIASNVFMQHYCAATPKSGRQEQVEYHKVLRWILNGEFDVVGFSCYIWNIVFVNKIASAVKEICPKIIIVYGGQQIRGFYVEDVFKRKECVDICVENEGEISFSKLLLHYLTGQPALADIPGIAFRERSGQVKRTGTAEIVEDLNDLPSPYLGGVSLRNGAGYLYEGSRGCPYRCSFCIWGESKGVREYEMDRVEKELTQILRHNPSHIMFCDGTFNMRKERARRILEILRDSLRDGTVKPFSLLLELKLEIIDQPTAAVIDELLQLNPLMTVEFGLQSATQSAAKLMRRPFSEQKYQDAWARLVPRTRSMAIVDCIYGLPGDGVKEFMYTVDFAYSLSPHRIQCFRLSILPGCEFERQAEEFEIKFSREPGHFVHQTKWVSFEEMLWLEAFGFAVCDIYHFHAHTTRCLLGETGMSFSELIRRFVDYTGRDAILDCLGEGERPEGRWRAINLSKPFTTFVLDHLCRNVFGVNEDIRNRFAALLRYETVLGATAITVRADMGSDDSSGTADAFSKSLLFTGTGEGVREAYLKSSANIMSSEFDIPSFISGTRGSSQANIRILAEKPCHLATWSRGGSASSGVAFPVSCKLSGRLARILTAFQDPARVRDVTDSIGEENLSRSQLLLGVETLLKNGLLQQVR